MCKNLISKYLKQSVCILSSGDKGLHFYENQDKNIFFPFNVNVVCAWGCCMCICVLIIFYFICFVWDYFLPNGNFFRTLFFAFFFFFPICFVWLGQSIKISYIMCYWRSFFSISSWMYPVKLTQSHGIVASFRFLSVISILTLRYFTELNA